jgi:hypothetical protein
LILGPGTCPAPAPHACASLSEDTPTVVARFGDFPVVLHREETRDVDIDAFSQAALDRGPALPRPADFEWLRSTGTWLCKTFDKRMVSAFRIQIFDFTGTAAREKKMLSSITGNVRAFWTHSVWIIRRWILRTSKLLLLSYRRRGGVRL